MDVCSLAWLVQVRHSVVHAVVQLLRSGERSLDALITNLVQTLTGRHLAFAVRDMHVDELFGAVRVVEGLAKGTASRNRAARRRSRRSLEHGLERPPNLKRRLMAKKGQS